MMRDAEAHAEEDRKRKEESEVRNKADQAVYAAEKMLQDMGGKLPADDKAAVETAVTALKGAISANDVQAMTSAMDQLTQAQHKAAEALYKTGGAAGADAGGGPDTNAGAQGSAAPGDVIDAEVVDEDKK